MARDRPSGFTATLMRIKSKR